MNKRKYVKKLDIFAIGRDYITNILREEEQLKCLFLDTFTREIIKLLFFKSDLFKHKVFDSQHIDAFSSAESQAKVAVLILKPTEENVLKITSCLSSIGYESIRIYFINSVSNFLIQTLAESDTIQKIKCIQEIFFDFIPVQPEFFTYNNPLLTRPYGNKDFRESEIQFLRQTESSLYSLFLSLRSIPSIRYSNSSNLARKVAQRLGSRLEKEYTQNHKNFKDGNVEILILDRRDDPITPLIYNWSYLSLVEELISIQSNSVEVSGQFKQPQIFSRSSGDSFLDSNWHSNYGEVSKELSRLQDEMLRKRKVDMSKASLDDMKDMMLKMPELKKQYSELDKHTKITQRLSNLIDSRALMDLSELQQDISVENDKGEQMDRVINMLTNPKIIETDKIKLCMLYCIKYSDDNDRVQGIKNYMKKKGLKVDHVEKVLNYCRVEERRTGDFFSKGSNFIMQAFSKLTKENPNFFERHKPKCVELVEQLLRGKLNNVDYPQINLRFFNDSSRTQENKNVIVFLIGGATYQELRELYKLAEVERNRILLGSNFVLNSTNYLEHIMLEEPPFSEPDYSDEQDKLIKK